MSDRDYPRITLSSSRGRGLHSQHPATNNDAVQLHSLHGLDVGALQQIKRQLQRDVRTLGTHVATLEAAAEHLRPPPPPPVPDETISLVLSQLRTRELPAMRGVSGAFERGVASEAQKRLGSSSDAAAQIAAQHERCAECKTHARAAKVHLQQVNLGRDLRRLDFDSPKDRRLLQLVGRLLAAATWQGGRMGSAEAPALQLAQGAYQVLQELAERQTGGRDGDAGTSVEAALEISPVGVALIGRANAADPFVHLYQGEADAEDFHKRSAEVRSVARLALWAFHKVQESILLERIPGVVAWRQAIELPEASRALTRMAAVERQPATRAPVQQARTPPRETSRGAWLSNPTALGNHGSRRAR